MRPSALLWKVTEGMGNTVRNSAGIQYESMAPNSWIPAFAGMTAF